MILETDECVGCATDTYPCRGDSCPNKHVKHYICDGCGAEDEPLYRGGDGRDYCLKCMIDQEFLEVVEENTDG